MPGCWMLEGLEWVGGGDGGDGIMWRGDWKKFSHAQASGARRILVDNLRKMNKAYDLHKGMTKMLTEP